MIVRFLRWACYCREVRIPFTRWTVWLEPNRCGREHPGGFFLDVDDKDGLIQLGTRWQVWMHNYGPSWAERHAAWLARNPEIKAKHEAQQAEAAAAQAARDARDAQQAAEEAAQAARWARFEAWEAQQAAVDAAA